MRVLALVILFIIFGVIVLLSKKTIDTTPQKKAAQIVPTAANKKTTMQITSRAFTNNSSIPQNYSCEGEGMNPPLQFASVPENTKSLVLIMEDPDVPKNLKADGIFDHWVVFSMPPTTSQISEGTKPPGIEGKNSAGTNGYTPPCPPDRQHRYFFKLYALDSMLNLSENATKSDVENAMKGHIIEQSELIGLYEKQNAK